MAHKELTRALQMAIDTGNERIVTQVTKYFDLPVDENCSDYKLIRMILEEGYEEIGRILVLNNCRIHSMTKASLKNLIELALEREYIGFLVLLVSKAIRHKAQNVLNNSLFYYISNINDKKMMDYILNKMTNLSGINASDTENFQLLQLFIGIIRNDYGPFERFKKMDIDINKSIVAKSVTLNGYTALHVAVLCENHNFTKTILNCGSKTSVEDAVGLSPIHHGLKIKNFKINKTLFNAFMLEYDCINPVDHHGISHFHIACLVGSVTKVERYLRHFSDVNHQINYDHVDYPGFTPLHLAVTEDFAPVVQLLLNYGADLTMLNARGMSPLHLAGGLHKFEIVNLLLDGHIGNVNNPVGPNGVSHFHIACCAGNTEAATMFLLNDVAVNDQILPTSLDSPLFSALHFAVFWPEKPLIKLLLNKGANPNCQESEGFTPLHLACAEGLLKSVETLLEFKVDLNIKNKKDATPLQTAIIGGHYEIVKRLVEEGVDINSRDHGNETPPLITAAFCRDFPIMHYLLDNGANAAAKQRDGKTALHILALVKNPPDRPSDYFTFQEHCLMSRFSYIDYDPLNFQRYWPDDDENNYKCFFDFAKYLIEEGCDINARDKMQCTPLHLACQYRCVGLVITLLQLGADIDAVDNRNYLAWQYLSSSYQPIAIIFYNHIKKLKYAGYPISSRNQSYHEANQRRRFFLSDVPSDFQDRYDKELNRMKNETIDEHFSLYDFLIKDPDDLLAYTNNNTLMGYIFHRGFKNLYPEFGALIQTNFRKAKKRTRLFMFAKTSMQLFTKVPLPDTCLLNIFRYLNEEDVKQLIGLV